MATQGEKAMIDERMFNLLRDQLSAAQAEKSSLYAQVASLTEEVHMLRESMNGRDAGLEKTIAKLQTTISENNSRISVLTSALKEKDKINASLLSTIEDLNQRLLHNRGKRFSRTSEQAALLNNRNVDGRASEKDEFDGKKLNDDATCPDEPTTKRKKQRKGVNPSSHESEKQFVNETITHRLEEYYDLPEGGHYIKRDGKVDITLYEYIEIQLTKVIKHVYVVLMSNTPPLFMHSMFESCHLNRIRPMDYFSDLFQCYRTLDDVGKVAMLPCYYTNKN